MKRNVYINCKLNIYTGLRLLSNKYFNFLDTSRVNRYELEKDTIIIDSQPGHIEGGRSIGHK